MPNVIALNTRREPKNDHDSRSEQFLHDIKSPLGALKIFLSQAATKETIALINLSVERIEDMIQKFESSMPQGQTLPFAEPVKNCCPNKIIYEVIFEKTQELARPIGFLRTPSSDISTVKIQRLEFKRVLSNLINNACEALKANSEGEISLRALCIKDQFILEIHDSGAGIDSHQIEQIFTRGFSTKNSSGLGLSHALKKIKEWNGDLNILSQKNSGTTVVISLPINPA